MRRLKASRFVRNVLSVASGTALAQVVVISFSPLITRIYSPEVFGLQGVFLSLVSILSPVIALRYPMAIITAETSEEASKVARLALLVAVTLTGFMWVIILIAGSNITKLLGADELGNLVFLLPLALFCVAMQNIKDYQAARLGVFRLIGIVSVAQAFVTNFVRVFGGLVSPVAAVLLAVSTAAPAVKAGMLMIGARDLRQPAIEMTGVEARSLLKKHRDFPIYRVPTDVIHALSQSAPIILLSALYSPAAAGFYLLAHTVIKLPLNILGSALGNVVYARIAELSREKRELFPFVFKVTVFQLAIPGGILAVTAFFFPQIFSFVFGENWIVSGAYAQWMALWIICMLINIPGVRALPIIGKQSWHLLFNSFIAFAGVGALILASQLSGSEYDAVMYFSVATASAYVLQVATYLSIVRAHDRKAFIHD